ncbi:aldehyde dehydrogenase (NADP(+)) [Mycetocola sp. 2940]|uniref:aldehyde dehydrogenase (NADP(+)) n=1 Tax=Mycetocola sp. 2940 TaxID=3156452 RepID=UPI00339A700E
MPSTLTTTDPRTGEDANTGIEPTTPEGVDKIVELAVGAATELARRDLGWRAALLESLADALEEKRAELVAVAQGETGLSDVRLGGELTRTSFQLRLFAEAVREGSFLEAAIDHAGQTPMGVQPDVRRMLVPVGPIVVFGSSNFPFAFSVPGGDTASALAAGNPVITKAHSAHPLTSQASYEALRLGAARAGAPAGTIGIVYGQSAGSHLVAHPEIAAVGFTGSLSAARHLREIIEQRDRPIPFYGELQSVNPFVITEAALAARTDEIASGLANSITGSAGQLCTKPGIAFIPAGASGDRFANVVVDAVAAAPTSVMLNKRVLTSFRDAERSLEQAPKVQSLLGETGDTVVAPQGYNVSPRVLRVPATELTPEHTIEAFGPLLLLVDYDGVEQLTAALGRVPDSLTASLHLEEAEVADLHPLVESLSRAVGRVVFNGFPTGVRVSWAQHHGGPWPATNSFHTSVGVTAIRRFLRPLAWQNAPEMLLPVELRDATTGVPRRIDGIMHLPGTLNDERES